MSQTDFAGTQGFMGPEMERLKYDNTVKVDLYYNDVYACI